MLTTHVVLILDKSGSMNSRKNVAVQDWNQQVEAIKLANQQDRNLQTFVTGIIFDNQVEVLFEKLPVDQVGELTLEQYAPGGCTALFDAIARGIELIEPELKNPTDAALVAVITDGHENASNPDNRKFIPLKIKELQDLETWTFAYLGTEANLADFQEQLHSYAGNSVSGIDKLGTHVTSSMQTNYFSARSRGETMTKCAYEGADPAEPSILDSDGNPIKKEDTPNA